MTQLMYGIARAAKPDFLQIFIDHGLYRFGADSFSLTADEQCFTVNETVCRPVL